MKTNKLTGAAMRCYVASKLGDEVDVPEDMKKFKGDTKKFKCILLRSQYQYAEVEAVSEESAEELAREMWDSEKEIYAEFVEAFDVYEVND
jgi:hypothetical protein